MATLMRIRTGEIDPSQPGKEVPKREWKLLVSRRQAYCHDHFQHDCKELLFFIDDGRVNKFFGYPDEVTYWREGLGLEPEAVPFAENYLRTRDARLKGEIIGKDWREVPFGEAVIEGIKLGKREIGIEGGKAGPGRGKKTSSDTTRLGRGVAYTLARLDRDGHGALATAVRSGELSANAAAISAGYRKKRRCPHCGKEL